MAKILAVHGYEIYADGSLSVLCRNTCILVAELEPKYNQILLMAGQHLTAPRTVDLAMRDELLSLEVPKEKIIAWSDICSQQRPPRDTMEEADLLPTMFKTLGHSDPRQVPFDAVGIWYYKGYIRHLYRHRQANIHGFHGAESWDLKRLLVAGAGQMLTYVWPKGNVFIIQRNRAGRNVFPTQPDGQPWIDNLPTAWDQIGRG